MAFYIQMFEKKWGLKMSLIRERTQQLFKPYVGLPKEVYIIVIARVINAMGIFVFPFLTLILTTKIGLSKAEAGLWISLSGFLYAPASMIGGKLADTIGRKKIIITFDILAALGYLACSFVEPSMNMVYLIIISATMMGVSDPAHNALIADLTNPKNRDGAFSLSYLGFNTGFAIAALLGGVLFENYLQVMFLGDALTALIATILLLFFVPETLDKSKEEVLDEERSLEKREEGSIFKVLLSRPILLYFSLIAFGYNFVYAQWGFLLPLHTEHNYMNEGAALYGKMAAFNGGIVILLTPVLTSLFTNHKNIRKIVYGGVLYVLGFGMLGFISTKTAFFTSVFIFTMGEILVTVSFMPFIANHTPASHRGRMNSILPIIMGFGFVLGPLGMGNLLRIITIPTAWQFIGIFMTVFTLLMLLLEKVDERNHQDIALKEQDTDTALVNEG